MDTPDENNHPILLKNNRLLQFGKLNPADIESACDYFRKLSLETLHRFGPHAFDRNTLAELYTVPAELTGYIARDTATPDIIAYAVIKQGFLEHDRNRLQSYGLELNPLTDCTYAPSVADAWQGMGVGNALFHFIMEDLKKKGFKRVILWGGVQSDNLRAVNYYLKNGFRELGQFEYHGMNSDMILDIL
jgi:diamine N-acetyltransferase